MKIITIDGQVYLGELVQEKTESKLVDALALGTVIAIDKPHLAQYLKSQAMKTLQNITIGGTGVSYSIRDLSEDQATTFEILKLQMKQAETKAPAQQVVDYFSKLAAGG